MVFELGQPVQYNNKKYYVIEQYDYIPRYILWDPTEPKCVIAEASDMTEPGNEILLAVKAMFEEGKLDEYIDEAIRLFSMDNTNDFTYAPLNAMETEVPIDLQASKRRLVRDKELGKPLKKRFEAPRGDDNNNNEDLRKSLNDLNNDTYGYTLDKMRNIAKSRTQKNGAPGKKVGTGREWFWKVEKFWYRKDGILEKIDPSNVYNPDEEDYAPSKYKSVIDNNNDISIIKARIDTLELFKKNRKLKKDEEHELKKLKLELAMKRQRKSTRNKKNKQQLYESDLKF